MVGADIENDFSTTTITYSLSQVNSEHSTGTGITIIKTRSL
jgi:hypothetical protein